MKFKIGSVIQERYEILQDLGEGGFASLFRVYDRELDRLAAVKILRTFANQSEESLKRFQREARIIAGLSHPNICSVYTFDLIDGNPCIFMEYLNGYSLSKAITENSINSFEKLQDIFVPVCKALSYAHKSGIIHRDLTPNNIFIAEAQQEKIIKVIDFGFAKLGSNDETRLTKTGLVVGSPHYMSPEQSRGQALDQRSDIYSLCCVLYEAFCGRKTYAETNPVTVLYLQQKEYPREPKTTFDNADRAEQIKAIILRGLQKDPEKRFQSCDEILAAFMEDGSGDSTRSSLLYGKEPGSAGVPPASGNLESWEGVVGASSATKARWRSASLCLFIFFFAAISLSTALILKQRNAGVADSKLHRLGQNQKIVKALSNIHRLAAQGSFDFMINRARELYFAGLYDKALADLDSFAKAKREQKLSHTETVQLALLKSDCYFKLSRGDKALFEAMKTLSDLENDPSCSDDDRCMLLQKELAVYGFFPSADRDEQSYRALSKLIAILNLSDSLSKDRKAEMWLSVSDYQKIIVYFPFDSKYRALVPKTAPLDSIENALKAKGQDPIDAEFVSRCWNRKAAIYYYMGRTKEAAQAITKAFNTFNNAGGDKAKEKCELAMQQANSAASAGWFALAVEQVNIALQYKGLKPNDNGFFHGLRASWRCSKWRNPGRMPCIVWQRNNPKWLHDLELSEKDFEIAENLEQGNISEKRNILCSEYAILKALGKQTDADRELSKALEPLPDEQEQNAKAAVAGQLCLAGQLTWSPSVVRRAIDLYQGIPGFEYEIKWAQETLKTAIAYDAEDKTPR